jgi:glycyl-tRNA synthetase
MDNNYGVNGLIFWNEAEIHLRDYLTEVFARTVETLLVKQNQAWRFVRTEAPLLTPRRLLNANYTSEDVYHQTEDAKKDLAGGTLSITATGAEPLTLRPETTPGSYAVAAHLLTSHSGYKPPLCVWQAGKSFRREADQPTKHMRLKEFYQQEFQCIYAADTKNDYLEAIKFQILYMIGHAVRRPSRLVTSDRLPDYSELTVDVEVDTGEKWMEVCSISRRTDFPQKLTFQGKNGLVEKDALVLEIAIGLDRCIYASEHAASGL